MTDLQKCKCESNCRCHEPSRLQYVKGYFKKFYTEADFRRKISMMSLSFEEDEIVECYKYINTLK